MEKLNLRKNIKIMEEQNLIISRFLMNEGTIEFKKEEKNGTL